VYLLTSYILELLDSKNPLSKKKKDSKNPVQILEIEPLSLFAVLIADYCSSMLGRCRVF
jgi:hypothetical protein